MKKSIVSIYMLTLMCLFSCDINFLNELLGKSREKFLEETDNVKDLNSKEENQEGKENQVDVSKVKRDVVVNKDFMEKSIELSQIKLTEDQESYLISKDAEANAMQNRIDFKLLKINEKYDELDKSLSELKKMEAFVIKAESDFDEARRGISGNEHVTKALPYLYEAIKTVKVSRHIAEVGYNGQLNALEHVKAAAEYAKSLIKSALGESAQARASGYYYVQRMIDNISKAETNLSKAKNMFGEIELKLDTLRNDMKQAKNDFTVLEKAYQLLLEVNKR
ncbi:hypothetical protein bcCo53_001693 (plasmid) [Borrelia coriaceae]|uniref:Putative cytosolic protein n=1 Tax=Borrelia coriaceae ATCC 43381 TaxID=1408429 RepID=W5SXJ7_9SPIR|nr:hypothetical protein [Borrelia coriaceae]AHH11617.1 Putative cytosolic protein [Borrelia coriaceae ATCC 43381]UPA17488.1 hypothetical protein bcCo53_001693 [Borrelia coriaceae]